MAFPFFKRRVSEGPQPSSLGSLLVVLFMLQIVLTVGMIIFLSAKNNEATVNTLKSQLRRELAKRIEDELAQYLEIPHKVNQLNAAAYRRGDLDVFAATGEAPLYAQLKQFPNISFAYCGSGQNGEFFGVLHDPSDKIHPYQLSYSNPSTEAFREYYSLDANGKRDKYLRTKTDEPFRSNERPWFEATVAAQGPAWTEVYIAFTTGLPNITASMPVYDETGELMGVCATDVVVSQEFRQFLKDLVASLEIGDNGKAIVLDRDGRLIADSTNGSLSTGEEGQQRPRTGIESTDALVVQTTQYLIDTLGPLNQLPSTKTQSSQRAFWDRELTFSWNNERQVVEILPFNFRADHETNAGVNVNVSISQNNDPESGTPADELDWLIVLVVEEDSLVEGILDSIQANHYQTWIACGAAILISVVIGVGVARSVASPILAINTAAKELAAGNWEKRAPIYRQDEIGELALSFNDMATQLKQSFDNLESQKNAFARFFPPEYLQFLGKKNVTEVVLGEHVSKEMSVMFSDIRDFTTLAETLTPQASFDFINAYLRHVSPEIRQNNGFVVKFLGDGLMAVFPGAADDAVNAGIAKCEKIRTFNDLRATRGAPPIAVGIGIHVGHIMVGMIGDQNRLQADALSDCVNLSARLEGLTKIYDVPLLISSEVVNRLQESQAYEIRLLDRVIVKGRKEAIVIHEVLNAEKPFVRDLKIKTRDVFHQAIEYYRLGYFERAKRCFEDVLSQNPTDKTAKLYIERLTNLIQHRPREKWTGVWVFNHK